MLKENNKLLGQALLVHIKLLGQSYDSLVSEIEFKELIASSGIVAAQLVKCNLNSKAINSKYLLGKGKLDNLATIITELKVKLVIFNFNLSAGQQKHLETFLNCKVLDRTELILHIFAKRARTFEGKLQVELAKLRHLSTRLVRVWTHLERQRGGAGLRSGPGEQQIEIDRRIISHKIKNITKKLDRIKKQRKLHYQSRKKAKLATISLVGYTNSGKSTLFNLLTNSNVDVVDMPFATLDPTIRRIFIPRVGKVLLSDTVGFIRDLPHQLIEAFKATLEEIKAADLLIHVIDISDNDSIAKKADVMQVLDQIGASNIPILEVYNKIDQLSSMLPAMPTNSCLDNNKKIRISALYNLGIQDLIIAIRDKLCLELIAVRLKLSPKDSKIRMELLNLGAIKHENIDPVNGNFNLDIVIQKQRWDLLCNKFINLSQLIIE